MSPAEVVRNRWLGFLIWQSIASTAVYAIFSLFRPLTPSLVHALLAFLSFHLSLLFFSLSLFLLASPHPESYASPLLLLVTLFRVALVGSVGDTSPNSRRRAFRFLKAVLFLLTCCVSGFLDVASLCWVAVHEDAGLGLGGAAVGFVYGIHYLYNKRWILQFPIVQRPLFFSFKVGLALSLRRALIIATQASVCSTFLLVFLLEKFRSNIGTGKFIVQMINLYAGECAVSICWELSHHLLQVIHTRRCTFAPPQGVAAEETNPSEILLEALERSSPRSHQQYLAYLDLCMVCESSVEPWRRAAFYEESGETYRRIIASCLKPLEQLTQNISDCFEGYSVVNKTDFLSQQLCLPGSPPAETNLFEPFMDFQICSWSSRAVSALTVRSKSEDQYGVAQLSGCNPAVVSRLLSALLAVEACIGKKSSQPIHLAGPANIKWVTMNTSRKNASGTTGVLVKRREGILYQRAYAMADVVRTSLYHIVSAFQADMQANLKSSALEKNWILEGKPLYGTRELLVQKLKLFMDFQAT